MAGSVHLASKFRPIGQFVNVILCIASIDFIYVLIAARPPAGALRAARQAG
jgi:hypothetical protein